MRLQKYLASCGVASRRAAEKLMAEGRVTVDGQVISHMGAQVEPVSYTHLDVYKRQVPVRKQPFLNSPIRWKHPPAFLACVFCAALRGFPPRSGLRPPVCSDNK